MSVLKCIQKRLERLTQILITCCKGCVLLHIEDLVRVSEHFADPLDQVTLIIGGEVLEFPHGIQPVRPELPSV